MLPVEEQDDSNAPGRGAGVTGDLTAPGLGAAA